jgi:Spy/CpxP family protein refolding chaperone
MQYHIAKSRVFASAYFARSTLREHRFLRSCGNFMKNTTRRLVAAITASGMMCSLAFAAAALNPTTSVVAQTNGTRATAPQLGILKQLGLTDAQNAQVQTIMAEARNKNASVSDPAIKRANLRAANEKVRQTVFTPAQRATAAAIWRKYRSANAAGRNASGVARASTNGSIAIKDPILKQLALSDTQKQQIHTILANVRAKNRTVVDTATKRANLRAASRKIRQIVLTSTQRTQAKALRRRQALPR